MGFLPLILKWVKWRQSHSSQKNYILCCVVVEPEQLKLNVQLILINRHKYRQIQFYWTKKNNWDYQIKRLSSNLITFSEITLNSSMFNVILLVSHIQFLFFDSNYGVGMVPAAWRSNIHVESYQSIGSKSQGLQTMKRVVCFKLMLKPHTA